MNTAEILLAAILLTTPPATTAAEPTDATVERLAAPVPNAWLEVLRPSLLALAIATETIDPREALPDLATLQATYQSLRDAPRTEEACRFPAVPVLDTSCRINREVRMHLEARRAIDLYWRDELACAVGSLDAAYLVLGTARDSQMCGLFVGTRRDALRRLRDLIGQEAFCLGILPAPVPSGCLPERAGPPEPPARIPQRLPR